MNYRAPTPFDSIEGAHEYLGLLLEAVLEARGEVEDDIHASEDPRYPRRVEALRLVYFKLEKLEHNLRNCSRLLNDLRTLQRLLLEKEAQATPSKSR